MSRILIVLGVILIAVGVLWPWLSKLPFGRLPGDILIERENLRLYLPITTMLIISVVLSIVFWFFRK